MWICIPMRKEEKLFRAKINGKIEEQDPGNVLTMKGEIENVVDAEIVVNVDVDDVDSGDDDDDDGQGGGSMSIELDNGTPYSDPLESQG
eukprot:gnl/Chilomastix_caulleri/1472.p1 GENE.gnl/Chilomastix_caulleri/1472~~gnl/Chilomastix_caulleri/1472.p1  ORF type:complete len:89 (+),score=23.33 gnl/Chilomastix_caulleri/1472:66-332(+)